MRFNPADWCYAVEVVDEASQMLRHALITTGATIARCPKVVLQAIEAPNSPQRIDHPTRASWRAELVFQQ